MSADYDVIILGLSRWDNTLNSSTLSIAKEFAKTQRVFYIDKPFSYKDYIQEKKFNPISSRKEAILYGKNYCREVSIDGIKFFSVTPRMSLPINFIPDGKIYEMVAAYNLSLVKSVLRKLFKDYSIKKYVYLNSFLPTYFKVLSADMPEPMLQIYRSCDDISQERYIARHGVRMEREATLNADLVITSSHQLRDNLSAFGKKEVYRVPNAADPTLFCIPNPIPSKPREMQGLKGKIILFTGRLSALRIDYPLLYKIAKERPNDSLLIVGLYEQKDLIEHHILELNNIHFTGAKPVQELKNYLAHADVSIIPFLKNTLTRGIYPLKINEYLAAGKPVVSTHFSRDIEEFKDYIGLAESHDDFMLKIDHELNNFNPEKSKQLIELSLNNTWAHRVQSIRELVETTKHKKTSPD